MSFHHHIIIIGAGPAGLYFASKCEKANKDYLLIEADDKAGGQLLRLYPEKEIVDIDGIESIKAKDYISLLLKQVNQAHILLNTKANTIEHDNVIKVITSKGVLDCDYLIIATGLGMSVPRPLGVEHENEVNNILYKLDDFSSLKDKRIAIFGGGDSALDWAKELSRISDNVHLIHRRTEFRGNPETIKDCKNLNVHLPFIPDYIETDGKRAKNVIIKEVVLEGKEPKTIAIPVDFILVNYGNIAEQNNFDFPKNGAFLKVDSNYSVDKNIFVIGDISLISFQILFFPSHFFYII